ncbi:hypothetical protein EKM02_07460 [Flavobacterium sp. RSP49]|uniref:hypothetical protein n=1 Tax=Flavobacterium sp. RSP49 TaxID=2497487 RepID=UPI000F817C75|nr:hypothetical protein [Flavobacterium sp. RSP49]RTZ00899.1 hypothetical protein EKM02_07460 [Flavobacterium sp. RSP49]
MVLNVIFSFNRAMQLDYLLTSILKNYKIDYQILVIYHTSGEHDKGYELLIKKYKQYNNFSFVKRKPTLLDISCFFSIKNKTDFKFFLKHSRIFNRKSDNFKSLLEKSIQGSDCEFVMFNTDDGYFFDDLDVEEDVLTLIRNNPRNTSYRCYVGENLENFPSYVKRWGDNYLWDYFKDKNITHWSYNFAVDGTIYDRKTLLKILCKVPYHNPVSLETNVVGYCTKNKLFGIGLGPITSKVVGTLLNQVSKAVDNPTINIDTEILNNWYVKGFRLKLKLPQSIDKVNLVPEEVKIYNDIEEQILYILNDSGREIQRKFGIGGTKL